MFISVGVYVYYSIDRTSASVDKASSAGIFESLLMPLTATHENRIVLFHSY